jgi:alpha-galactosidase
MFRLITFGLLMVALTQVLALDNGLGLTPQMGWNSWNAYHCDVNEHKIKEAAEALMHSGLASLGYNIVDVDDCWAYDRDPTTHVVRADPKTFPSGMRALADYVHSLGLQFGAYTDLGTKTCAGRPGSLGYEQVDAQTYAEWQFDYIKVDNCHSQLISPKERYPVMRDALNATGRPIFYSMCEWGFQDPATWGRAVANSARTTPDIADRWESMIARALYNDLWHKYAGPGYFNDPDMLEVGNGGMTDIEYRTHFTLWCLMKSPLLIGTDVANMTDATHTILANKDLIAINQDPLGVQANRIGGAMFVDIFQGPLQNGDVAVALVNRHHKASANITVQFDELTWAHNNYEPSSSTLSVRDLWQHAIVSAAATQNYAAYNVQPHQTIALRLSLNNN